MKQTTIVNYSLARRPTVALLFIFLLALTAACGGDSGEETALPTPIVEATQPAATTPAESPTAAATAVASPTSAAAEPTTAATPTIAPTLAPTETSAAPTEEAGASDGDYRVVYVTADDVLNVREGPGPEYDVVGELASDAEGIAVEEQGQTIIGESTWVQVEQGGVEGWVNSRFLTEAVETAAFCEDADAQALIEELGTAIASEDGLLLGSLIHPERGLRIRHDWWNPEVFIEGEAAADLFTSEESYEWGTQDGSGFDITGTFAEVILPTLQEDFLGATELGCDELLSGATAGLVQLPEEYEPLHFFSAYRPSPESDETGFDWGTWVVGIDRWQGEYYLSYLVHFDYEI